MENKNNGFVISTLLYGLLIMSSMIIFTILATVTFNKKTTDYFTYEVEKKLLEFADNNNSNTCDSRNQIEEDD